MPAAGRRRSDFGSRGGRSISDDNGGATRDAAAATAVRCWHALPRLVALFGIAVLVHVLGLDALLWAPLAANHLHDAPSQLRMGLPRRGRPLPCSLKSYGNIFGAYGVDAGATLVLVLGVECSGSKLAAQAAARMLGIPDAAGWPGYGELVDSSVMPLQLSPPLGSGGGGGSGGSSGGSSGGEGGRDGSASISTSANASDFGDGSSDSDGGSSGLAVFRGVFHLSLPQCERDCVVACYVDAPALLRQYYAHGGRRARVLVSTRDRSSSLRCKSFWHQMDARVAAAEQAAGLELLRGWMATRFGFGGCGGGGDNDDRENIANHSSGCHTDFDLRVGTLSYEALVSLGDAHLAQDGGLLDVMGPEARVRWARHDLAVRDANRKYTATDIGTAAVNAFRRAWLLARRLVLPWRPPAVLFD